MKVIDYQIGELNTTEPAYKYCVTQADGIYDVFVTKMGKLIFKVVNHSFKLLPQILKEGVILNVPKIPISVFKDLLEFYRFIYQKHKSEVYVAVYYDPENNVYKYFVPKQQVSGGVAKILEEDGKEIVELRDKYIHVLETHSHHTMTGRFSSIDDADHQIPDVVHLVIGDIERQKPTYQLRIACGDKKVDLKLSDVFDIPEEEKWILDLDKFKDWETNVKLITYQTKSNFDGMDDDHFGLGGITYGGRLNRDSFIDESPIQTMSMAEYLKYKEKDKKNKAKSSDNKKKSREGDRQVKQQNEYFNTRIDRDWHHA